VAPVAPDANYENISITKGFRGSPHVDHRDVTHQHVIALGEFEGGDLCAEEMAEEMAPRNKLGVPGPTASAGAADKAVDAGAVDQTGMPGGGSIADAMGEVVEAGGAPTLVDPGPGTLRIDVKGRVARIDGMGLHSSTFSAQRKHFW